MPAGLTRLQAVEGAEVVLPVWYTLGREMSSAQPWELLTVMWFLEQKGKELNQVRKGSVSAQGGWRGQPALRWKRGGQPGTGGGAGRSFRGQ